MISLDSGDGGGSDGGDRWQCGVETEKSPVEDGKIAGNLI